MTSVQVYNMDGSAVETLELNSAVFDREVNAGLMHQAVVLYLASRRQGTQRPKPEAKFLAAAKSPGVKRAPAMLVLVAAAAPSGAPAAWFLHPRLAATALRCPASSAALRWPRL